MGKRAEDNTEVRREGRLASSTSNRSALGPRAEAGHHLLRARDEDVGRPLLGAAGRRRPPRPRADQLHADLHTREHHYLEVEPPFLVNAESLRGTGNLPSLEQESFENRR